ncbi:MAG: hypothetical protein ACKVT0_03495 [Planctomycetaceae bacterium]
MNTTPKPETVREFLDAFEEVFDRDWAYSKEMLTAFRVDGHLEDYPVIGEDATFIHPKVGDEVEDWGNRARLLQAYRALKKELS